MAINKEAGNDNSYELLSSGEAIKNAEWEHFCWRKKMD